MGNGIFGRSLALTSWPKMDERSTTPIFVEMALHFEEFTQRTVPHTRLGKFKGTTLSLQERGWVLRNDSLH